LVKHHLMCVRLRYSLENWQHRLHEVSTRRCTRIDCAVRWVGTKIREPPRFHGVNDLEAFLTWYEDEVLDNHETLSPWI
jgi:hypothetical protein